MAAEWKIGAAKLPGEISAALSGMSAALQVVAEAARVAKVAVDIARTLSGALRDPVALLAEALQAEIEGLLADLRQAGAYVCGDWGLARFPYDGLRGGYAAYERRMVARLVDRADPTRPDLSAESTVAAVFLYAAGTPTSIDNPLALLGWLTGLLSVGSKGGGQYPAPSQVLANPLGVDGQSAPDAVRISWRLPFGYAYPPAGFVVSLSTTASPLRVVVEKPGQGPQKTLVQVTDETGRAPEIFGGADQLAEIPADEKVYGLLDGGAKVDLASLDQGGGRRRLQRFYRVGSAETMLRWPTGQFFLTVKRADLPQTAGGQDAAGAGAALTYFARVAAVPREVADGKKFWKYDLGSVLPAARAGSPPRTSLQGGLTPAAFGAWSAAAPVTLPGAGGGLQNAAEVVAAALAVLALSRPDLPVLGADTNLGKAFAAAPCGLEAYVGLLDLLFPQGYPATIEKQGRDPLSFRVDLYRRCLSVGRRMLDQAGPPPSALRQIVASGRDLLRVRLSDLLESAGEKQSLRACREASVDGANVLDLLRTNDPASGDAIRAWARSGAGGVPPKVAVPPGASRAAGIAPNPTSAGLAPLSAAKAQRIPGVVRVVDPQLVGSANPASEFPFRATISPEDAPLAIQAAPGGIREIYERFRQVDGSVEIPKNVASYVSQALTQQTAKTSADLVPMLVVNPNAIQEAADQDASRLDPAASGGAGMLVLRSLFAAHQDGVLLRTAAAVLSRAGAAALRTPQDGSWIAFRPLDMVPGVDAALDAAASILGGITQSAGNAAEAAGGFSDFLGARIQALSDAVEKLRVLIGTASDALNNLPEVAALPCVGRGTDEITSQLVSSRNKPKEGPAAYAAGAVILAGGSPSFLLDLFGGGGAGGGADAENQAETEEPQVP